jgi:hypothetical protein
MPSVVLLVWFVSQSGRWRRPVTLSLSLFTIGLALLQTLKTHRHPWKIADLPSGTLAVTPEDYSELSWLAQRTNPGDYLLQSTWLNVYPALKLQSPVYADGFWPGEITRPEDVAAAVDQLAQKQVPYILWTSRWTGPSTLQAASSESESKDHLNPLRTYLKTHYRLIHTFPTQDEVWARGLPDQH